MKSTFDIRNYGAIGDGYVDDWPAIQAALSDAMAASGCLLIPAGLYLTSKTLSLPPSKGRLSIVGEGANNSIILARDCGGLSLAFEQHGIQQPFGVSMRDVCFRALGKATTGIVVSYAMPPITNDHIEESVSLTNVQVVSDPEGTWDNGIEIESAWNVNLSNCFVSGDSANGVWNNLHGTGLNLRGMTVNCHVSNCRFNFWATGMKQHSEGDRNSEGLFVTNTSMVGTHRGVWIKGSPEGTGRISTFIWKGGMIECRFTGVGMEHGKAAFHFERLWTGLVQGCQMLGDTIDTLGISYGVIPQECHGIVVSGCDINAFNQGVFTTGDCRAMNINGNTFTNVAFQVTFTNGTTQSRSYGHTLVNNIPMEIDESKLNKMGFIN